MEGERSSTHDVVTKEVHFTQTTHSEVEEPVEGMWRIADTFDRQLTGDWLQGVWKGTRDHIEEQGVPWYYLYGMQPEVDPRGIDGGA